jgi:pantoate--beta-alanine ligase
VSIFVNPTQFNDPEDFRKYPVSLGADIQLLEEAGCDVLFIPSVDEVYPAGTTNTPAFDFGSLETVLEGAQRPGHFRGVGQVVARLLQIVEPEALYLGKKDYQQCMVITDLVRQMGMDGRTRIILCPTVREQDGLALSSRNRRLTEPQRALAGTIYQCLVQIQAKKGNAPFTIVQKESEELLKARGFEPEYVALADADNLQLLNRYEDGRPTVALIAARIGGVRLIDNVVLE